MDLSVYHASSTPNPRSAGPTPQNKSVGRQALADTLNTSGIVVVYNYLQDLLGKILKMLLHCYVLKPGASKETWLYCSRLFKFSSMLNIGIAWVRPTSNCLLSWVALLWWLKLTVILAVVCLGTQEPAVTPIHKEARVATFLSPHNSPAPATHSTHKKKRRLRSKIEEPLMIMPLDEKGSTEATVTKDNSHEIVTRKLRTRRTRNNPAYVWCVCYMF